MTIGKEQTEQQQTGNPPPSMLPHRLAEFDALHAEHLVRFAECGVQPLLVITVYVTGDGLQLSAMHGDNAVQILEQPEMRKLSVRALVAITLDLDEGRFP